MKTPRQRLTGEVFRLKVASWGDGQMGSSDCVQSQEHTVKEG